MSERNRFDHIRTHALAIIESNTFPEMAKDILIRMVADEESLVMFLKTVSVFSHSCPDFAEVLCMSMTSLSAHVIIMEATDVMRTQDDDDTKGDE